MKKVLYLLLGVLLINSVTSCSDNTIGTSVTDTRLEIVADSSFTVTGSSVKTEQILTRTMTQLLGAINVDNFGELSSDFVCQFLPTTAIDTTGVTADMVDSIRLILRSPVGGYTGDSIMPMRINVYQLNQQLKAPLSSSFDPEGYYNQSDLLGSISYTATRTASPDLIHTTVEKGTYRTIVLTLPKELAVKCLRNTKKTLRHSVLLKNLISSSPASMLQILTEVDVLQRLTRHLCSSTSVVIQKLVQVMTLLFATVLAMQLQHPKLSQTITLR